MKRTIWQLSLAAVIVIGLLAYFIILPEGKTEPEFMATPYVFWMGILLTAILVSITYVAQKNFPFKDESKS